MMMGQSEHQLQELVVQALENSAEHGVSYRQLLALLGLERSTVEAGRALARLSRQGRIEQAEPGKWRLRAVPIATSGLHVEPTLTVQSTRDETGRR